MLAFIDELMYTKIGTKNKEALLVHCLSIQQSLLRRDNINALSLTECPFLSSYYACINTDNVCPKLICRLECSMACAVVHWLSRRRSSWLHILKFAPTALLFPSCNTNGSPSSITAELQKKTKGKKASALGVSRTAIFSQFLKVCSRSFVDCTLATAVRTIPVSL